MTSFADEWPAVGQQAVATAVRAPKSSPLNPKFLQIGATQLRSHE
jgi:hypothetical protein